MKDSNLNFHVSSPIFRVSDLARSLDYFNKVLGFATDWGHESGFASVSRQAANILLCLNDQGNPGTWIYIGVGDVVRLHEELAEKGAIIKLRPTNYPWAMEIHVTDPDGNVIRFGSEPDATRPFDDWVFWYK